MTCMPLSSCEALGMWLLTGPLVRHPELKVVFVEPGLGWVAYYLYFLDDMVLRQGYEFPVLEGELPSFYYHRNMAMTFIDEPDPIKHLLPRLGVENVMWSSDYPHPVSTWPKSESIVAELFADTPPADRDLMVSGNARRIWSL
jgi:predicted TIM-barrel fold metal-dependent hydrolase